MNTVNYIYENQEKYCTLALHKQQALNIEIT